MFTINNLVLLGVIEDIKEEFSPDGKKSQVVKFSDENQTLFLFYRDANPELTSDHLNKSFVAQCFFEQTSPDSGRLVAHSFASEIVESPQERIRRVARGGGGANKTEKDIETAEPRTIPSNTSKTMTTPSEVRSKSRIPLDAINKKIAGALETKITDVPRVKLDEKDSVSMKNNVESEATGCGSDSSWEETTPIKGGYNFHPIQGPNIQKEMDRLEQLAINSPGARSNSDPNPLQSSKAPARLGVGPAKTIPTPTFKTPDHKTQALTEQSITEPSRNSEQETAKSISIESEQPVVPAAVKNVRISPPIATFSPPPLSVKGR